MYKNEKLIDSGKEYLNTELKKAKKDIWFNLEEVAKKELRSDVWFDIKPKLKDYFFKSDSQDEINYLSKMLADIKPQPRGLTLDDLWSLVTRYRRSTGELPKELEESVLPPTIKVGGIRTQEL